MSAIGAIAAGPAPAPVPVPDPRRRAALRCAIETLLPGMAAAGGPDIERHVLAAVAGLPAPVRRDFSRMLAFLASPLPGLLDGGRPASLAAMEPGRREALLARWAVSRLAPLRRAFAALKRMSCFIGYGASEGGHNPLWPVIGYPGPPPQDGLSRDGLPGNGPELAVPPSGDVIDCDVLVIGSGAGGGVVAGTLSARGLDVVVVDKGPYVPPDRRSGLEHEMVSRLYEDGGMLTTRDHALSLFAGSCIGGGTTVNWSVYWRPDDRLLEEWAAGHALPHLRGAAFRQGIDHVMEVCGVRSDVPHNRQNQALLRGAERLGYSSGVLGQNVRGCEHHGHERCGYCLFGCRYGCKQDGGETFLAQARRSGTRIHPHTHVRRLHRRGDRVTHAEAEVRLPDGRSRTLTIRAGRFVLAAGAVHTPALLLRSGFDHPQIGRNLYLHPVVLALGRYPQAMETWRGGMMTSHCDAAADLDGRNHGCRIETAPLHSGLLAAVLPWRSAARHRRAMEDAPHYAAFAVITRDRFGGRVRIDRDGRPRIHYRLHRYDRRHAIQGTAMAAAIHAAAGAERVLTPHHDGAAFDCAAFGTAAGRYHRALAALDWSPNRLPLFSAHLMGTCRMGGNRDASPVAPDGRLAGCRNLYVADGSVFPSASGINPVLTIQAMACHTARCMAGEVP